MEKKNFLMIDLTNKHILITGGSSGIGKEIAILASKLGALITLIGRNNYNLTDTYSKLSGFGHNIIVADITNYDIVESKITDIINKSGVFSCFIHCAGLEKTLPLKLSKPNIFRELFEINVIAGFNLARIISEKGNFNENGASFIFISSIYSTVGQKALTAYSSSKSALISGVKSLALELAHKKIRCNCVSPGYIKTEMITNNSKIYSKEIFNKIDNDHPLGLGEPIYIANLVVFLLSDLATWITGTNIIIDGGYTAK